MSIDEPVRKSNSRWATGTGVAVIVAGVLVATIRFQGGGPDEHDAAGLASSVALGAIVTAPGILAVLSVRRPSLRVAAGVALIPMAFLSFALTTLALLLAAMVLIAGYALETDREPSAVGNTSASTVAVTLLLLSAGGVLVVARNVASSTTTVINGNVVSGGGGVGFARPLLSIGLTLCAVFVGWMLAAPRESAE